MPKLEAEGSVGMNEVKVGVGTEKRRFQVEDTLYTKKTLLSLVIISYAPGLKRKLI